MNARLGRSALALVARLLCTQVASADPAAPTQNPRPRHHARWDAAWPHSNAWDYTLAGVGSAGGIFELTVLQPIRPPLRWSEPVLFDADVRSALRVADASTRSGLEDVAWGIWVAQMALPVLVDVPFAWAKDGFWLARDLFWQDVVTLTIAGAIDGVLRDVGGRARPDIYDCLAQGGGDKCLTGVDSTRSFPGGHLANSAAAAGLVCTQHLYTRLYGGPWDGITCVSTIMASVTLGMFRIMSDNHWATDQLVGGAIGGLIGWGIPFAMHFHGHRPDADAGKPPTSMVLPMPMTFDHGGGLGVTGLF